MRVVSYQNEYRSAWDKFVRKTDQGTMYHSLGWKNVIEKTFGFRSMYLMALSRTEEIQGILPLFLMKDVIGKKYLIPFHYSCPKKRFRKRRLIS